MDVAVLVPSNFDEGFELVDAKKMLAGIASAKEIYAKVNVQINVQWVKTGSIDKKHLSIMAGKLFNLLYSHRIDRVAQNISKATNYFPCLFWPSDSEGTNGVERVKQEVWLKAIVEYLVSKQLHGFFQLFRLPFGYSGLKPKTNCQTGNSQAGSAGKYGENLTEPKFSLPQTFVVRAYVDIRCVGLALPVLKRVHNKCQQEKTYQRKRKKTKRDLFFGQRCFTGQPRNQWNEN